VAANDRDMASKMAGFRYYFLNFIKKYLKDIEESVYGNYWLLAES
jgi:hypothetical protein